MTNKPEFKTSQIVEIISPDNEVIKGKILGVNRRYQCVWVMPLGGNLNVPLTMSFDGAVLANTDNKELIEYLNKYQLRIVG